MTDDPLIPRLNARCIVVNAVAFELFIVLSQGINPAFAIVATAVLVTAIAIRVGLSLAAWFELDQWDS